LPIQQSRPTNLVNLSLAHIILLVELHPVYGAAYLTGFGYLLYKSKDLVAVMIDADSTYQPEDILALLAPILEGKADMTLAPTYSKLSRFSDFKVHST